MHPYIHTQQINTCTQTHTDTYTDTHTLSRTYTPQISTVTCNLTWVYPHMYAPQINTHTHTHTHTRTHTHHRYMQKSAIQRWCTHTYVLHRSTHTQTQWHTHADSLSLAHTTDKHSRTEHTLDVPTRTQTTDQHTDTHTHTHTHTYTHTP